MYLTLLETGKRIPFARAVFCVTINLPRIAQESEKDKNKFFDLVRERFELAARTLGSKTML